MTTDFDVTSTEGAGGAPRPKSRRGSEKRQRTAHMTLRLLPQQRQVASVMKDQLNMPSIQAMFVDACEPLMSAGTLEQLAADHERLQAVAEEHGITPVQALLLLSWTSPPAPTGDQMAC